MDDFEQTDDRLDGWKAIALYLKRDLRTVQRWERLEGLPIHRQIHQKQATAYAYRTELDSWRRRHEGPAAAGERSAEPPSPTVVATPRGLMTGSTAAVRNTRVILKLLHVDRRRSPPCRVDVQRADSIWLRARSES